MANDGRRMAGVTFGWRWEETRSEPPVTFTDAGKALAAASQASDLPAGVDTLHLARTNGGIELIAVAPDGRGRWLRFHAVATSTSWPPRAEP